MTSTGLVDPREEQVVRKVDPREEQVVERNGRLSLAQRKIRVEGKFFIRGRQRIRIQGVTYGPFAPDAEGQPFPTRRRVQEDFALMREGGINAIRTYTVPPEWFFHLAEEQEMAVLVGMPW